MDLGEDQGEVGYPAPPVGSSGETPGTLGDVHLRYTITICGCSSRVYAPIGPAEEALYKELLGKIVFSEHARQRKDSLDAVHRLVPLWEKGQASLDWVKDEA